MRLSCRLLLVLTVPLLPGVARGQTVSSRVVLRTDTVSPFDTLVSPQVRSELRARAARFGIAAEEMPMARLVAELATREGTAGGQVVTTTEVKEPQWLGQTGLTAGNGTTPTVSVQVYRYWLGIGQDLTLPFFVLGELPTTSVRKKSNAIASILEEYGGSLNVAVGTPELRPSLGRFLHWPTDSPFGLRVTGRAGMKIVDVTSSDTASTPSIAALVLGTASAKLLLPIWNDATSRDENNRAGSIQGEITANYQWSNSRNYRQVLSEGTLLDESLFFVNANAALIITNYLYASAGFTLNVSDERLERKTTVTFRYLR